jgi:hypothetical protein
LLNEKVKEKTIDILQQQVQLMDTVNAEGELAYTDWQTQMMSAGELKAINEIFRKQFFALREINNILEVK